MLAKGDPKKTLTREAQDPGAVSMWTPLHELHDLCVSMLAGGMVALVHHQGTELADLQLL
eukprot:462573-Pyramimonas_sp.AAC.1